MNMNKILALSEYLNIEYFDHNGTYYSGANQEEYEGFKKKKLKTKKETNTAFDEYIDDNYNLLEEEFVNNYDKYYQYGNEEYLVLTDQEADKAAYDSVYSIWEDCYLSKNIKEQLGFLYDYIDLERATLDTIRMDGRGRTLASYDGYENEINFDNIHYYIYRIN